jgi:glyoxylase-like metal-dependent hydrolase (beta-lactamase superfamily II)
MDQTSPSLAETPTSATAIVKGITVGLLEENCYLFGCAQTKRGVIIDPGDNPRAILKLVQQSGLAIERIINTHAHFDHVMAVNALKTSLHIPFCLHQDDLPMLHDAPERVRLWLDMEIEAIDDPDEMLTHGQVIQVGNEELEVRFTPGHAPGHVVFVHHAGRQVFAGDTLFRESIGRYDLPMADGPTLLNSIRRQLFTLADDYRVYPGHGPATTIGYERRYNPFVGE